MSKKEIKLIQKGYHTIEHEIEMFYSKYSYGRQNDYYLGNNYGLRHNIPKSNGKKPARQNWLRRKIILLKAKIRNGYI